MSDFKETWYNLEQGLFSPRDECFGWRLWGHFESLTEARRAGKKLGRAYRILRCEIVETKTPGFEKQEQTK